MAHSSFLPVAQPRLQDLKGCEDWLGHATLADPGRAVSAFLMLFDELEDAPPRHAAYLQILERLRAPIRSVQEEQAKRFAGKPLPLGHAENAALVQSCDLWLALLRAYRLLWKAALKGRQPELAPSLALLCQRVLSCNAALIGVHQLARREVGANLWQWLHEAYAIAEARGVAAAAVADDADEITCAATYAQPLLAQLADPYRLSAAETDWLRRWIARWARKVRLGREASVQGSHAVDLAGNAGATWMGPGEVSESLRFLDLSAVGRSVTKRIHRLATGAQPAELGLGHDCTAPAARELLRLLARAWLGAPEVRPARRGPASPAKLASGFAVIHHAIGGKPAEKGADPWDYSRRDAEQLHIFQRAIDVAARRQRQAHEPELEEWESFEEFARDFRLRRRGQGARIALRQLVALRPETVPQFILCEVHALVEHEEHALALSVRALPGFVRACSVRRAADSASDRETSSPALLLSGTQDLFDSLVLPIGWYQGGCVLELQNGTETRRIKLFGLLARGSDYERVNFSAE